MELRPKMILFQMRDKKIFYMKQFGNRKSGLFIPKEKFTNIPWKIQDIKEIKSF